VSCRFVYNFYIAHNKDVYEKQKRFVSGMDFSKWLNNDGVGIDLGIKNLAVVSNTEKPFKNINKTKKVKELEKKLKREQRKLSRKYESLKVRNKRKGGNATRQNIQKQIVKVQKLHNTLTNIRDNYINQVVNEIVKTKPSYISIEDLNVSGMMKNKHLARVIA
jgi:putative transposase